MSQYTSMPPPGAYVPPNQNQNNSLRTPPPPQGYGTQQQSQGYQQPQGTSTYLASTQGVGQQNQAAKGSGGTTFGQMMNQAVTTSKPMLNKLSKTISSKLGSKPSTTEAPQHLHTYQNYHQHHHAQQMPQPQFHAFKTQTQQMLRQQQVSGAYHTQQSPFQQSNHSNSQSNYSTPPAPSTPQTPYSQPTSPLYQSLQPNYNGTLYSQGGNISGEQQSQIQQGHYYSGQTGQLQPQGHFQQPPQQATYAALQVGVVGGTQVSQRTSDPHSPQALNASPHSPSSHQAPQQNSHTALEQSVISSYQQQTQSYFPNGSLEHSASNSRHLPPLSSTETGHQSHYGTPPASTSPPPPPPQSKPASVTTISPHQSQSSTPAPQPTAVHAPTEFIAELPADLGSLSIAEAHLADHAATPSSGQQLPFEAYQFSPAPTGPSSPGFTIARRAVSVSSAPYADPWRFVNPLTEMPTREFYVIADVLFEALDRKFEPQNTGMLEASKVLRSWIDLSEDATQLFSHNFYGAFARLWTLQGIPHVMVPCRTSLTPIWNFNQHSHAQELKLSNVSSDAAAYVAYMPALNRAGWYKFFFLEMLHGPDNINKLVPALCSETYKPGLLHHPDLTKRDKTEAPALQSRAAEIQAAAINQVCNETKAALQSR